MWAIHSALKLGNEMVSNSVVGVFHFPYKRGLKLFISWYSDNELRVFSFIFMVVFEIQDFIEALK